MNSVSRPSIGRILCIHPNGELYGSDRVFVQAVQAFRARWPDAQITIVLPVEGPLAALLRQSEPDVRIEPMVVLRRANLLRTGLTMAGLLPAIWRARRRMAAYDRVYISTVVVLDYLLATRWRGAGTLVHVHELPTGRTQTLIRHLLGFGRGRLLYISAAVRDAFPELRERPHAVVWNGTRDFQAAPAASDDRLDVLLIGRFNAWKGQGVLIDAVARLTDDERRAIRVRLIGSVFEGQEHFREAIAAQIAGHGLEGTIEVLPFDPVPDAHYGRADVVVVPSTKPEPFGLVAIEAMSSRRAVIAADHGGLAEIVVDGETGILVPPGDVEALVAAIRRYIAEPTLAQRHGRAGRLRYEAEFTEDRFKIRIAEILASDAQAGSEIAIDRDRL